MPNFTATVSALATDAKGSLYAGGLFSGEPGFNHIARWDGQRWAGLGRGPTNGTTNTVNAILAQGTNVFVGGDFVGTSNQYLGFVAMWDGKAWQALGSSTNAGVNASVHALAGDGTNIFVGGTFTIAGGVNVANVAKWDGVNWQILGAGLGDSNSIVSSLALGTDGSLYAGGTFTNSGASAVNHIARFNGTNWEALGVGVDGPVQAIAFVETNLYIAGAFGHSGAAALNSVGRWDGSQWQQLSGGLSGGTAAALASDGTNLYVGGTFTAAGSVPAGRIASWDGTHWAALSTGMDGAVQALAVWQGMLCAAGDFTTAGSIDVPRTARWDGQRWSPLHNALDGGSPTAVNIMCLDGTNLVVGGNFTRAGGVSANNVALWDGTHWVALGSPATNGVDAMPWGLAVSGNGQIYVAGFFSRAGGKLANGVARWDGTNWFPLGSGLDTGGIIQTIVFGPDDHLYAGGRFTSMGGVPVHNVASWDGTNWSDVGGGVESSTGSALVRSLVFYGTNLYVGGYFDRSFFTLARLPGVAVWDGSQWAAIGSTQVSRLPAVDTLIVEGTNLYAGGLFTQIGGVNATNLAVWNGQTWSAVGSEVISNHVYSVVPLAGELIIGGQFGGIGSQVLPGIARLLNGQWWPLGSGLDDNFSAVNSLLLQEGKLFVAGNFTTVGNQNANGLAIWDVAHEVPLVHMTAPTNQSVFNGYQSILLSASAASPNGSISNVTFYEDGNILAVVTNPPYEAFWTNLADGEHTLSARATDITGADWTNSVSATIHLPLNGPIITQEPQTEKLANGASTTLTVRATGNGILAYQWFKDGALIAGATTSALTLTNTQLGDSAMYTVQVSDSVGTNTSARAPVSVLQPVNLLWTASTGGGGLDVTSPAIGLGGTVYVGNDSRDLFAFGANSAYQWRYETGDAIESSAAVGTDGTLYFGSNDRNVYALTPEGDLVWTNFTSDAVMASPALATNGTIYVGVTGTNFYALNPNGSTQWTQVTPGPIYSAAAIGMDGTIYVAVGDGKVYAFSVTGSNLWKFATGGFSANSPIVGDDGTIYIGSTDHKLYAISPNGSEKWHFTAVGAFSSSAVIGPDGTLYIANDGPPSPFQIGQNGRLYAISPDGTEKWEFPTAFANRSSPAVSADGTIYFASYDQKLYAVNPNGTERWEIADSNPESSPAIRFDGVIYAGAGPIYAVQGTSPLAKSAWPMFLHDPRHTGNAASPPQSDGWFFPFGSNQFDDQVNAVAIYGTDVYVGGNFHVAGGITANHVARWDGTNWSALGEGLDGLVQALTVAGGNLYAGGQFTNVEGEGFNYLARWDGNHWRKVGPSGPNEYIYSLASDGNVLFAGGGFTTLGGIAANHVAQWDGAQWTALAGGAPGLVTSMAVVASNLYVGQFSGGVARWDGSAWTSIGQPNDAIWAVAADSSSVYIGGTFTQVNGVAARSVARWNGTNWFALEQGVGDPVLPYVQSLTLDGTNLYVGGGFTVAGATNANRIALWDGSNWSPLGTGIRGQTLNSATIVNSIGVQAGSLFIGGAFLSAGGDRNIKHFARWDGTAWSSVGPIQSFVNGNFGFALTDQIGRTYGIEASSDLKTWTRVATYTNLDGVTQFIDTQSTNLNRRFYRAVTP